MKEMIHEVLSRSPGLATGDLSRRIYQSLCKTQDYRQSQEMIGCDVARLIREEEADGTVARIDGAWWPGGEA